jgi:signal transduction histidine kinase
LDGALGSSAGFRTCWPHRLRLPLTSKRGLVLYVDDEPENLTAFEYCFGDRFEILSVASGKEALQVLERQPVAVLLADQRMPGMTGVELCAIVRERFPDVVRMIVTAFADISAAVAAINSGQVARYIVKPWHEESMAEELRAGVEAHDVGTAMRQAQARMLHHEREATSSFLVGRLVNEMSGPVTTVSTTLHFLTSSLSILAAEAAAGVPPRLAERVQQLDKAARDAGLVADELVARLRRSRAGEAAPLTNGVSADLNRTVQVAIAIVGSELRRHAKLDVQLSPVPPVRAEATQLSQIVVSLLTNVIEAFESSAPGNRRVRLRTLVHGARAVLEVEDTGAEIAAHLLPRVFDAFVGTKSSGAARGLTLAVVRDLMQRLRGDIRVSSEAGRGTRVVLELPLAPE